MWGASPGSCDLERKVKVPTKLASCAVGNLWRSYCFLATSVPELHELQHSQSLVKAKQNSCNVTGFEGSRGQNPAAAGIDFHPHVQTKSQVVAKSTTGSLPLSCVKSPTLNEHRRESLLRLNPFKPQRQELRRQREVVGVFI